MSRQQYRISNNNSLHNDAAINKLVDSIRNKPVINNSSDDPPIDINNITDPAILKEMGYWQFWDTDGTHHVEKLPDVLPLAKY